MQTSSIVSAIKQICNEKGIAYEAVIDTLNAALAAAYRKDFGHKNQNIRVDFDPESGIIKAFDVKTVVSDELVLQAVQEAEARAAEIASRVAAEGKNPNAAFERYDDIREEDQNDELADGEEREKRYNPKTDIGLTDAKFLKEDAQLDDEIKIELPLPGDFGRMAAQTAKQVITQRLREAERQTIFHVYKEKEHTVLTGVVQRVEGSVVLVDLGRAVGILPRDYQVPRERFQTGDRVRVYVVSVNSGSRGAEILLSRVDPEIVRELFSMEIPEVANASIEIKAIAREAGSRSKVAVYTEKENIDPIGSCVGQRGTRVQTIIAELSGEKIDIIEYSDDSKKFVANALLPAKVQGIEIDQQNRIAMITVMPDQLSLAIGRDGQNVRLAAQLTSWKINIQEEKMNTVSNVVTTVLKTEDVAETHPNEADVSDAIQTIDSSTEKEVEQDTTPPSSPVVTKPAVGTPDEENNGVPPEKPS